MPFAKEFDPVYTDVILPVAQKLRLKACRADDVFSPGKLMRKIWSQVHYARLVIADFTGRNPNVFYELGIAHTLDKPVILLTQNLADIPTDLQGLEVLLYENSLGGARRLSDSLENALRDVLGTMPNGAE